MIVGLRAFAPQLTWAAKYKTTLYLLSRNLIFIRLNEKYLSHNRILKFEEGRMQYIDTFQLLGRTCNLTLGSANMIA